MTEGTYRRWRGPRNKMKGTVILPKRRAIKKMVAAERNEDYWPWR